MQQHTNQNLISTEDTNFIELVDANFRQDKPVIALLRYSHQGGAREYFILRSHDDFQFIQQKAHSKDALTVFFSQSFPINGVVDLGLIKSAINYLRKIRQDGEEAVFIIRLDSNNISLDTKDMKGFSEAPDLENWLSNNMGVPIYIGLLSFWEDNSAVVVTAYVPDVDGQVHRGAY